MKAALTLRNIATALVLPGLFYYTSSMMPGARGAQLTSQLTVMACLFALVFILADWPWMQKPLERLAVRLGKLHDIPSKRYAFFCAAIFLFLTITLSEILFENLPHVADTHAQYVHARILLSGHLYLPSHPLHRFFDFQNMVNDGKYYSVYAPGHIILLAATMVLGMPWLLDPLMGSLTVIALYYLALEIGNKTTAMIAAVLMIASPFMVFMSSEYMNNVTCECCLTVFLLFYIRQHKCLSPRDAIYAGLAVGYAFFTRPQSTLPYALPVAIHAVAALISAPKERLKPTLYMGASFLFFVLCLLGYNHIMNDNAFVQSRTDPLKFLRPFSSWSAIAPHIGWDAMRLRITTARLHQQLFGWPFSSLVFVFLLFQFRLQPRYGWLLAACCLMQVASLIINPFFSNIFGPRYLYEISTCLIILTALLFTRLSERYAFFARPAMTGSIFTVMLLSFILAFPAHDINLFNRYKNNYHEGNAPFYRSVNTIAKKPALIFFTRYEDFRLLYFTMPPLNSSPIIIAQDRGAENRNLMNFYPNRSVYVFDHRQLKQIR